MTDRFDEIIQLFDLPGADDSPGDEQQPRPGRDAGQSVELGTASMKTGQYEQAIEHFKRAMAQGRDRADAMEDLGAAYESADMLPQAYHQYRKALKVRDSGELHLALSSLFRRYGRLKEAAEEIQALCEKDPTDAYARFRLAEVLRANGCRKAAAQAVSEAVVIAPDDSFFHYWHADLLLESGDFEGCVEAARAAVELSPADEHVMLIASLALWGCDKRSEAVRAARLATELVTGENKVPTLILWQMLRASGQTFEADALTASVRSADRYDRQTAEDMLRRVNLHTEQQPYMR